MGILSFLVLQGLMQCSSATPQGLWSWIPDFEGRNHQAGDLSKNSVREAHSSLERPDLVHHGFGGPLMVKERGSENHKRLFLLVFCLWRESEGFASQCFLSSRLDLPWFADMGHPLRCITDSTGS